MLDPGGTRAFVTDFNYRLWVIDLTGATPVLASAPNPIPISNYGEDIAITADGRFLVVSDGSANQPLSIVDVASQSQIGTFSLGHDCNAVDVGSDGSVLVASYYSRRVRRLTIDASGALADTGESLSIPYYPMNVYCAPGGQAGVVVLGGSRVQSFTIPGLVLKDTRYLSGSNISAAFSPDGGTLFVKTYYTVEAFTFDPSTGAIGSSLFVTSTYGSSQFFGMDLLAINRQGTELFSSEWYAVKVYDAASGAYLRSISAGSIYRPTGISVLGGEIDKVVLTAKPETTTYAFTISYKNPVFEPVVIGDTVPAEWQVIEVAGNAITDGYSGGLVPDDDGMGLVEVYPGNDKPDNTSATKILWYPARYGEVLRYDATLTVKVQTRVRPGKTPKYAPTSAGALLLNAGAGAYGIQASLLDPYSRTAVLDFIGEKPPLTASQSLCLAAVYDYNGDGVIAYDGTGDEDGDTLLDYYEACILGTNPCNPDSDGDGVPDQSDAFPSDSTRY